MKFDRKKIPQVTAISTDDEIVAAINYAGGHRYPWRRNDFPEEGSSYTKSWVKPQDIGDSNIGPGGDALLKRLKIMTTSKILEMKYAGNLPRFRVKRH